MAAKHDRQTSNAYFSTITIFLILELYLRFLNTLIDTTVMIYMKSSKNTRAPRIGDFVGDTYITYPFSTKMNLRALQGLKIICDCVFNNLTTILSRFTPQIIDAIIYWVSYWANIERVNEFIIKIKFYLTLKFKKSDPP